MGRLRAASTAVFLALAAALGLSACGGGGADLLPGKTATEINRNLDQVRTLVAEGDCAGAEDAVDEVRGEVEGLGEVDGKLKAALRQGTTRLGEVVSSCGEEALAEQEAEGEELAEEEAEQEEQAAVEAEEEELDNEEEEQAKQEKKKEAADEKEQETEGSEEEEETPESAGKGKGLEEGKGPPEVTPGGAEPPAGGVGPGTEVE